MKLNVIRNSVKGVALLLGTALVVSACQREELARPDGLASGDGVVRFAPEIASGEGVAVKSADTYRGVPVSFGELTSEDGTFAMPISCEVSTVDEPATKATLINDPGTTSGPVLPLGEFASKIGNTFWVTAWDNAVTPSRIIPDATAKAFTGGYVAGGENGWYQKVMYRDGASSSKYWMTVQPYSPAGGSATIADDEYIWKKDEALKTFFAYANLPESGATVANTAATSQTLALTSLPDKDILLGYYSGEGYSGSTPKMTGTASIHFYHPLTAVKFKKGTLSEGVTITGISIKGVYTSGKTTQTPTTGTNFVWTKTNGNPYTAADETGTASLSSVTVDDDSLIGDAIVLIPETFANADSRIVVTLSTPKGAKTVYYPLEGQNWAAGNTYVFTIGYDNYEFTFELTDSEKATQTFTNTTAASSKVTIGITSKKTDASGETTEEWRIQSYQIGSSAPVDVRSTSFTGGGLEVSKSGSNLTVKAQTRTSTYGSHDYWMNSMKRTDRLDWSPAAWSGVTDLSRLDYKSEIRDAHSMTTANCYIIRHAGTYKFPLVYGNGVIDGTQNNVAFSDAEHKNHLEADITDAFIENNDGCTATSCEILWQDEAAVIGTPEIVGATVSAGDYDSSNVRYIQFTVDETTICQNNALIAVKDSDGNIMWSWHIWITNDPALLTDAIPVVNRSSVTYYHFPLYSLGWVDANYAERETVVITLEQTYSGKTAIVTVNQPLVAAAGNGTYYQFGRKDPMCRKNNPAKGNISVYSEDLVPLSYAIQHPDTFIQVNTNTDWCNTFYDKLWKGPLTLFIKTIYDPSPVGYKIPPSSAYNFVLQSGTNSKSPELFNTDGDFSNGWNFYTGGWKTGSTIFFPAAGLRNYKTNKLENVGTAGRLWSAETANSGPNNSCALNFSASSIYYNNNNFRPNGFSVRPVKEQ